MSFCISCTAKTSPICQNVKKFSSVIKWTCIPRGQKKYNSSSIGLRNSQESWPCLLDQICLLFMLFCCTRPLWVFTEVRCKRSIVSLRSRAPEKMWLFYWGTIAGSSANFYMIGFCLLIACKRLGCRAVEEIKSKLRLFDFLHNALGFICCIAHCNVRH